MFIRASILYLLLATYIASVSVVMAQGPAPTPTSTAVATGTPTSTATPTVEPTANPEVIALRAQVEEMRWFDTRLMAIVGLSISVVLGLAIGLAVYNGWVVNRSYERDLRSMQQEVEARLHTETARSMQELRNEMSQRETTLKTEFDHLQMMLMRQDNEVRMVITRENARLEYDVGETKALFYEQQGLYWLAAQQRISMIYLAKLLGDSHAGLLTGILVVLESDLQFCLPLNDDDRIHLSEALDGLPQEVRPEVDTIRALVHPG